MRLLSRIIKSVIVLGIMVTTFYSNFQLTSYAQTTPIRNKQINIVVNEIKLKNNSSTIYSVSFGYESKNNTEVSVIGNNNIFTTEPSSRGQVGIFKPGKQDFQFSIDLKCGETAEWSLIDTSGKLQKAKAEAPICGAIVLDDDQNPLPDSPTCENPVGWIEDETARTEKGTVYFVPKKTDIPQNTKPKTSPELFKNAACATTSKINFKDKTGKYKAINNDLVEIATDQKEHKDEGYKYSNKENDFQAYFAEDPNNGWKFQNDKDKLVIKKVTIAGKSISKNSVTIDKNTITYVDIVPGVDLRYVADNTGVSKYFIIKNKEALVNDLSSIEFEIDSAKKISKTNQQKTSIENEIKASQTVKAKQTINDISKSNEVVKIDDISSQIDSISQINQNINPDTVVDKVEKATLEEKKKYLDQEKADLLKLKEKVEQGKLNDSDKLKKDVLKITEKGSVADKIEFENNSSIKIAPPVTFDSKFNDISTINHDTFTVSPDGKKITILPNLEYLNATERQFPIFIDPRFDQGQYGAGQDATINLSFPSNNRNTFWNGVGGFNCITIYNGTCTSENDQRALIGFSKPANFTNSSRIESAYLSVKQYSHTGGAFSARVLRLNSGFNESVVRWNSGYPDANQNDSSQGNIFFPVINYGYTTPGEQWTTSSNIAGLVEASKSSDAIWLELRDSDEYQARGAIFCSKEGGAASGHPCNNGNQGEKLQVIFYNGDPKIPNYISPNNQDVNGGCNLSELPQAGNCSLRLPTPLRIENVDDGNGNCANTSAWISHRDNLTMLNPAGSTDWANVVGGCGPNYTEDTLNGRVTSWAHSRDN
ncbi:MAG: hypothetical protein ACRCXZ_06490, partial [Patescibacteria group bacterium]